MACSEFFSRVLNPLGGLLEYAVQEYFEFEGKGLPVPFMVKVVVFFGNMIISSIVSTLGLFFLYLIFFRPYAVRPHVDSATLSAFYLTLGPADQGNTVHYDLALNVTFFNDHRVWAIRFNHFAAWLYFNGTKLGAPDDTFPKFKGRTRRHRTVHPVLIGRAANVSAAVADEFSWERLDGWFTVEVRLKTTLTYIIWPTRYVYYYEYDCWLRFPSDAMPAVIGGVKCSKGKRFGIS